MCRNILIFIFSVQRLRQLLNYFYYRISLLLMTKLWHKKSKCFQASSVLIALYISPTLFEFWNFLNQKPCKIQGSEIKHNLLLSPFEIQPLEFRQFLSTINLATPWITIVLGNWAIIRFSLATFLQVELRLSFLKTKFFLVL